MRFAKGVRPMIIQAARTTASATESGAPPPASVNKPVELTTLEWPDLSEVMRHVSGLTCRWGEAVSPMTRSMLLARCTAAGVLALALETAGFWWTTRGNTGACGGRGSPDGSAWCRSRRRGLGGGRHLRTSGRAYLAAWAAVRFPKRDSLEVWRAHGRCGPSQPLWYCLLSADPLRQRESVLVGGSCPGHLLGTRLGFFTLREYDGLETAWQPLLTITVLAIVAISAYLSVPRWFSRPVVSNWGRVCLLLVVTGAATISVVAVGQRGDLRELAAGPPSRTHPPVVLIVLDTLRADHLSLYGYPRNTMPRLTKFAQEQAVVVERAIANAPDSLSAHASLFTGLFPVNHRAHRPFLDDPAPPRFGYGLDPPCSYDR